jgi:presequence protease
LDLDKDSLRKCIIGTIGGMDSYQLPDAKGFTAFRRHLLGLTDEERQRRRDHVLSTTAQDFRKFADVLEVTRGLQANMAVVTNKQSLEKAHEQQPGAFDKVTTVS